MIANTLIEHTGLPTQLIEDELSNLFLKANIEPDNLSLDQLRDLMAEYLQDVFLELKTNGETVSEIRKFEVC